MSHKLPGRVFPRGCCSTLFECDYLCSPTHPPGACPCSSCPLPPCCSDKLQSDTLSALVKRRRRRRRGESDKKVPARISMECHVPRQSFPQSPKSFANATNYDYCLAILLSLSLLFIFPQNNFPACVGGFSRSTK